MSERIHPLHWLAAAALVAVFSWGVFLCFSGGFAIRDPQYEQEVDAVDEVIEVQREAPSEQAHRQSLADHLQRTHDAGTYEVIVPRPTPVDDAPYTSETELLLERLGWSTLDLWDEDLFWASAGTDLGLDDPRTLEEIVVRRPTEADLNAALEDEAVRVAASVAHESEVALLRVEALRNRVDPSAPGAEALRELVDAHRATEARARLYLLQELERASGYPCWSLVSRAYDAWPGIPDEDFQEEYGKDDHAE